MSGPICGLCGQDLLACLCAHRIAASRAGMTKWLPPADAPPLFGVDRVAQAAAVHAEIGVLTRKIAAAHETMANAPCDPRGDGSDEDELFDRDQLARALFDRRLSDEAWVIAERLDQVDRVLDVMYETTRRDVRAECEGEAGILVALMAGRS